jgi:hypothetical protein
LSCKVGHKKDLIPIQCCVAMLASVRHVCKSSFVVYLFASTEAILKWVDLLTETCIRHASKGSASVNPVIIRSGYC